MFIRLRTINYILYTRHVVWQFCAIFAACDVVVQVFVVIAGIRVYIICTVYKSVSVKICEHVRVKGYIEPLSMFERVSVCLWNENIPLRKKVKEIHLSSYREKNSCFFLQWHWPIRKKAIKRIAHWIPSKSLVHSFARSVVYFENKSKTLSHFPIVTVQQNYYVDCIWRQSTMDHPCRT